ncbi:restriction endonuclease subunit S [Leptospira interrogans]|uniref:restriction endonuclease subunit S n=1 Tax=Leptospira interrogans TaxID=173 RepID=UPI00034CDACD|nr:restriction endonuclease subunit S [Leptospira interrogans]
MSQLNFLEKLLDGVAVEWKTLGEVAVIKTGQSVSKQMILDNPGDYPVINSGRDPLGFIGKWNTDNDPIGVTTRGAGVGSITWQEGKYFRGNLNYSISINSNANVTTRYLYHLLLEMQANIHTLCTFDGIPALNAGNLKELQIPIPPLPVQVEIVRILDAFTELTTELTTELASELTARKKQYNYYRDQLLRFEQGEVEWKTLGEVTLPTNNIRWSDTDHSYRYIDLTSVSRENNLITETSKITARNAPSRAQKLVEKDDVIFATTRPTQQRLCLINDEYAGEIASTGYCVLRAKVDEILPKWIYYCISSIEFKIYVQENQSGSAYPAISDAKVKEFKLPIPPLAEQERIVDILDKFDALTNSISEGLPREIRLRQKQYEHYRELLLSFPKAEVGPT